ncbi:MAG: bacteriohemerythrin [Calditrichia bacterium]
MLYWENRFSVKIDEIDNQHKQLFDVIRKILNSLKSTEKNNAISEIIESLCNYVEIHFRTEEEYFDKFQYPEADEHIREHNAFRSRIKETKKQLEKGEIVLSTQLLHFLAEWVIHHIESMDQKYAGYFAKQNLLSSGSESKPKISVSLLSKLKS